MDIHKTLKQILNVRILFTASLIFIASVFSAEESKAQIDPQAFIQLYPSSVFKPYQYSNARFLADVPASLSKEFSLEFKMRYLGIQSGSRTILKMTPYDNNSGSALWVYLHDSQLCTEIELNSGLTLVKCRSEGPSIDNIFHDVRIDVFKHRLDLYFDDAHSYTISFNESVPAHRLKPLKIYSPAPGSPYAYNGAYVELKNIRIKQFADVNLSSGHVVADEVLMNGSEWKYVEFPRNFAEAPIVVAGPVSKNDSAPVFVVIRNVTSTGFEGKLKEWDYQDGFHGKETFSYIAASPGLHNIDGMQLTAQSIVVDEQFTELAFPTTFQSSPAVFTQLQIGNATYQSAVPRMTNVTPHSVSVSLQEQESHDGDHWFERVNVIAVSQGEFLTSRGNLVQVGKNQVDHLVTAVSANLQAKAPLLFGSVESYFGGDPVILRNKSMTPSEANVQLQEETSADPEIGHVRENVSWMIIDRGFEYR